MNPFHKKSFLHVRNLSPAMVALFSNRLIAFVGARSVGIFFPIFLYEFFGGNIHMVLAWYILYIGLLIPGNILGAKLFSRIGLGLSMMLGTFGVMLYSGVMAVLANTVQPGTLSPWFLLGAFGLIMVNALYWTPFHIDFALFTPKRHRGRSVALIQSLYMMFGIFIPLVAGLIIGKFGFGVLFTISLILMFASVFPLIFLPKIRVQYEFGLLESYRQMFSKRFRNFSVGYIARGAEDIVSVVAWPVFIFLILDSNVVSLGIIATILVLIAIMIQLLVGKWTDRFSRGKMLHIGTGLSAAGWVAKSFVTTTTDIVLASGFHSFGLIAITTPMEAMMYHRLGASGHYVDEYSVLREVALAMGRFAMLILMAILFLFFSINAAFVAAASVTLLINLFTKR